MTIYYVGYGNDDSISPEYVGRTLTLAASDIEVRVLDGMTELARHRRRYDRQRTELDPEHQQALLKMRRRARSSKTRVAVFRKQITQVEATVRPRPPATGHRRWGGESSDLA